MSVPNLKNRGFNLCRRAIRCASSPRILLLSIGTLTALSAIFYGGILALRRYRLSPAAELKSFVLAPGFHAELVASEPLIQDPVALAFDPQGRIWVCEMQGFMPDASGTGEGGPIGRIVILEDTNGDSRMDKSTVFLDQLVLPRAIALVNQGALVAEPPKLWFCPDQDGDGKADAKLEVDPKYTLRSIKNPELLPNGLLWSMDNQIYSAKSDTRYRSTGPNTFARSSTEMRGQWGLAQDDWGRLFYNYNFAPLHGDLLLSPHYTTRNPNFRSTALIDLKIVGERKVFPVRKVQGVNTASAIRHGRLGEYTSACGPTIYRGDLFEKEFRGNAFVCEPTGNLISRFILSDSQGAVSGRNPYKGHEFCASRDERFRPVNLYTGPDGALWVVDMYRGVIQHHLYINRALKKYAREKDLEKPVGMGRIWRIVPDQTKPGPLPKITALNPDQRVALLEHPNGWQRDTAQRLLVESGDRSVGPALVRLLKHNQQGPTRLHALWTLDGLGLLEPAHLTPALDDPEPKLRAAAVRLSESLLASAPELKTRLFALANDPALEVQIQLMFTLGELREPAATDAMLALLAKGRHPDLVSAALTGLAGRESEFLAALLASPAGAQDAPLSQPSIEKLLTALIAERRPENCEKLVDLIAQTSNPWPQTFLLNALANVPHLSSGTFRPIVLAKEPAQWSALTHSADHAPLLKASALFSWPEKPSALEPKIIPLNDQQQERFRQGQQLYLQICAACHQSNGQGQNGLAPPLLNSEWVLGEDQKLIRIILNGIAGSINVSGTVYNMEMPALNSLNDEQVAAVLTYIRREWDHPAAPVEPSTIAKVRSAVRNRQKPWSAKSLHSLKL